MSREGKSANSKAAHNTAQPLTLAVVSAGRLGSALACALAAEGYRISTVVARRKQHARRSAQLFPHAPPHALAASELAALPPTDLLIIATPDDQIAALAADPVALRVYALLGAHALHLAKQKGVPVGVIKESTAALEARWSLNCICLRPRATSR